MALKFRLVQRKVMSGKNAGKKLFFASPTSRGKISYERFCREVAEGSTVETADVKAVIDRMVRVLHLHISEGESVECGELGIFSTTFGSAGVAESKEFVPHRDIRRPRIAYRPSGFLRVLTLSGYERVNEEGCKPQKPQEGGGTPQGGSPSGEDSGEGI